MLTDEQKARIDGLHDQIDDVVVTAVDSSRTQGAMVGTFSVKSTTNMSDVGVYLRGPDRHVVSVTVPLSWMIASVKAAGYKIFEEV